MKSKFNKFAVGTIAVCGLATAGLLAAPGMVLKSVPTATVVKVEKVEHVDTVSLSGTIMRNFTKEETYVQTYVAEQDISRVEIGQTAEITGDAFPGTVYIGTVDRISVCAGWEDAQGGQARGKEAIAASVILMRKQSRRHVYFILVSCPWNQSGWYT